MTPLGVIVDIYSAYKIVNKFILIIVLLLILITFYYLYLKLKNNIFISKLMKFLKTFHEFIETVNSLKYFAVIVYTLLYFFFS